MSADVIKRTVEGLLSALGAKIDTIEVSDGPRTVVAISSPDSKLLLGATGEVLQALNTLARRLVEAKLRLEEPWKEELSTPGVQTEFRQRLDTTPSNTLNFLIDINGYHEAKLDELRKNARVLADRARLFKHEVEMPPMTSYERLVVHELFADDPEIETTSSGEGKFRHVVLRYKVAEDKEG